MQCIIFNIGKSEIFQNLRFQETAANPAQDNPCYSYFDLGISRMLNSVPSNRIFNRASYLFIAVAVNHEVSRAVEEYEEIRPRIRNEDNIRIVSHRRADQQENNLREVADD